MHSLQVCAKPQAYRPGVLLTDSTCEFISGCGDAIFARHGLCGRPDGGAHGPYRASRAACPVQVSEAGCGCEIVAPEASELTVRHRQPDGDGVARPSVPSLATARETMPGSVASAVVVSTIPVAVTDVSAGEVPSSVYFP